jgi:Ca2+-binding EF-hand superfamily protein
MAIRGRFARLLLQRKALANCPLPYGSSAAYYTQGNFLEARVIRSLILLGAAPALALGAPARGQAPAPAKQVARTDLVKRLDAQFSAVDANRDGVITKAELETAERRALQQRILAQFKLLDTNHDGQLSQQEFAAGAQLQNLGQVVERLVQNLDTNHDGKIAPDEFRTPQLANFDKVDANHDGVVTPAEIQAYAKAHPPKAPPAR